ncbi:Protein FAM160A1 [Larimichthys crocea]|uniref:Uncharacterized protein n=1 Tax=Larimichthys crocea TaxID=215358 RepID=A0ACD3RU14_LARCR|nr:Protein FAM160A1 [Larimichthys crocea]
MMASMVANGNRDGQSLVLKGVDPETCMIVFKNHWAQVVKILEKHDPLRSSSNLPSLSVINLSAGSSGGTRFGPIPGDEASAVQNYVEHMLFLLMEEECGTSRRYGPHPGVCGDGERDGASLCVEPPQGVHRRHEAGAAKDVRDAGGEGTVGQQARDALLLIMSLSAENERVAKHVAENTFFCPVLATGLSGLYSSLPTKLEVPNEEWHCLHKEDWLQMPSLVQFLNSLEFCNAVIQVAHSDIRNQLVAYIYNGFLVPVLAPALHKLTLEEVMTTTAYLDLFLRSVSEPALLQTFLSFILLHQHDNVHILDTLVSRINTPFQLGTVSLALFRTLIGLYCEDVMLQLILRYLIPCNHMMLSQRRVVRERDCYSVSAAKILALTPSCCSPDHSPPPLRQLDSILFSKGAETPNSNSNDTEENKSFLEEGDGSGNSCTIGSEIYLDVSYLHYLYDARMSISSCIRACQVWSAAYDGEDPPPEKFQPGVLEDSRAQESANPDGSQKSSSAASAAPSTLPAAQYRPALPSPSWSWSGMIVTTRAQCRLPSPLRRVNLHSLPVEPPQHIQEMRKTAIMLVKGAYIEENEFQDDVMVYDLVAKKDSRDVELAKLKSKTPESEETQTDSAEVPLKNGLSLTLPTSLTPENSKSSSDTKAKGQTDCNSNLQNNTTTTTAAAELGDDLLAQYEELIRTLDTEAGGKQFKTDGELKKPVIPLAEEDDEEEEMDFTSFSAETPEPEKLHSPFGKFCSGSVGRSQSVPFTGPFVSVLLSRMENMLSNSLHVNLLLTGILAQLAAYPQPLLRSFLLNTNLVFQPTVRSLYQVLATVKHQIEELAASRKDFPELITAAQHWLLARETSFMAADKSGSRHSTHGEAGRLLKSSPPPKPKAISLDRTEVFATVLFTEFLKEMAAIAQEHSILSYIPMEE